MVRDRNAISELLRVRLSEAGIPAAMHAPDALAELFPAEFNIRAMRLGADDLARVLIHFLEQEIIVPNKRSGAAARKVGPGWHACHFYRDTAHLLEIVVPYVAEGLQKGEACLWVMPSDMSPDAVCKVVARDVDDVEARLASGQLELLVHQDWYLDAAGRLKSFEEIGGALIARQDQALERGFSLLRAAGDAGWVSCSEQSKEFIDYENKVNDTIHATKVAAICTYRADVTAEELIAIVQAHQDGLR